MIRTSSVSILIAAIFLNILIWVTINKPHHPVESEYPINGLSLNPYKIHQSPFDHIYLTWEDLEADLKLLASKTRTVRLYSSTGGLEQLPQVAKKYVIKVVASAFLDDPNKINANDQEVLAAIRMAKNNKNVSHVIIGNETQLHKIVPHDDLVAYLRLARKELKTPVSTAEPWDYWVLHPDMVNEVDFITVHILPYWNEVPIQEAVGYVMGKYQAVKNLYPKKIVMIGETGWPSDGPQKGAAVANQANQAAFIRDFVQQAEEKKIFYNIIEAFDQPWKNTLEGRAGEHWGIMDATRREKFPLKGPVLEDPNWKYWAMSSTIVGFLAATLFLFRRRNLHLRGQIFSVLICQALAALATEMARQGSDQYMSPGDIVFWTVMITLQALLAIIFLTDAVEIAEVVGNQPLKRRFMPAGLQPQDYPFVSIHVACCNEPPDLMIQTLNSLAELDYPNFEVMVIDNNTPDPATWEPVQKHCDKLGPNFRFFSLGKWPGFKAGALNFALKNTDPRAQVVGVVDADYIVKPEWLKATIPYFLRNEKIAIVQAPQEHREWEGNIFTRMENDEYSGFFRIGMVQRNEHNAIIQHGTMTLIRRPTLDHVGGWAEWCICEDSELGLRVLNEGFEEIYLDCPLGHGLVPDTYQAYAKQRFRWAFGGMCILRHHWKTILGLGGNLSRTQRYQFIKGWLPWIGDALHMVFTLTALLWSFVLALDPVHTDFPEAIFIYPALGLVFLRLFGTLWTYTTRVRIGKVRTILAMIAGGSLTHKIAKAVFQGLLGFSKPFYRTPKLASQARLLKSLAGVMEEIILATLLLVSSLAVLTIFGTVNDEAVLWSVALLIQGIPYYAAIIAAIVSGSMNSKALKI